MKITCIEAHAEVGQETSYLNGALLCPSLTYPWANAATLKKLIYEMFYSGNQSKKYIYVDKKLLISPPFLKFGINFAINSMIEGRFDTNYTASYGLSILTQQCLAVYGAEALGSVSSQGGSLQLFSSEADRDRYFGAQSKVVPGVRAYVPERAVEFESSLSDPSRFRGGFIHSDLDRTMDVFKLCKGLRHRAEQLGVTFLFGRIVDGFTLRS